MLGSVERPTANSVCGECSHWPSSHGGAGCTFTDCTCRAGFLWLGDRLAADVSPAPPAAQEDR